MGRQLGSGGGNPNQDLEVRQNLLVCMPPCPGIFYFPKCVQPLGEDTDGSVLIVLQTCVLQTHTLYQCLSFKESRQPTCLSLFLGVVVVGGGMHSLTICYGIAMLRYSKVCHPQRSRHHFKLCLHRGWTSARGRRHRASVLGIDVVDWYVCHSIAIVTLSTNWNFFSRQY